MRRLFVASCLALLTWGSAVDPELSYSKLPDDGEQAVVPLPEFPQAEIAIAPAVRADTRANTAALLVSTGYADQYEIPDPVAERVRKHRPESGQGDEFAYRSQSKGAAQ